MGFAAGAGPASTQEFNTSLMNQGTTSSLANQGAASSQQLGNEGQTQQNLYSNLLQNYLGQFANAAGVNSGLVKAQPGVGLGGNGGAQAQNPYGLNPNQQTYLNSQVDAIQQAKQNALQAYQGHLGAQGQINPALAAEGAASINQHFSDLTNQTQAGAQNQVQQQDVSNLGNLMNLAGSEAQQGAGMQQEGAAGTLAAGGLSNSAAETALSGSGQQANLAMQDAATNPLGSALSFLGNAGMAYLTGGGASNLFGGGSGSQPNAYNGPTYNPSVAPDSTSVFGPPAGKSASASLMTPMNYTPAQPNAGTALPTGNYLGMMGGANGGLSAADAWQPDLQDPNTLGGGASPYGLMT